MTTRSTQPDAVALDGVRYRIVGPVLSEMVPQVAEKITIGPTSTRDLKNRNTIIWKDFHNGNGLRDIRDLEEDTDYAFWSYAGLRTEGHTVLPPLATLTAAVDGATSCTTLGTRASTVYGTFNGTAVRSYDNGADSWSASLKTLPGAATDVINFRLGGTEYIAWATTGGYTYYDGVSFVDDSTDTEFLAFWDNRLWGISNTGSLWWSATTGTEVTDAQLPLPDDSVQGLFVGRSTNAGRLVLYASTTEGLYIHDADSNTFELVDPQVPEHQDNGLGFVRFLESTFYSAGLGIYQYINQPSQATVTVMGLDRRGGLIADHIGTIEKLAASHNELIAQVDTSTNEPAIYGWRDNAWQTLWDSGTTGTRLDTMLVSTAYSVYRLWFSYGGRVEWIALPRDVINPLELSTYTYATSGEVITPWLDGREISDSKLALELFVHAHNATSTETIVVDFATNDSASFTNLGTITSSGVTTYTMGSGAGVAFRNIRFRFTLARGGTNTNTPNLGQVEFHWIRPLDVKWRHTFTVKWDGINDFGDYPEAQYDKLITAANSTVLLDFTFRNRTNNDSGTANPYNYYVRVVGMRILQEAGENWYGTAQITVEQL